MKNILKSHRMVLMTIGFLSVALTVNGQETICGTLSDTTQTGEITYNKSPLLDTLLMQTIRENKKNPKIPGYRIQIHYGTNRHKARSVEKKFEQAFPTQNADLIYEQPYFKIRIGHFRSKIEAHKLFHQIKNEFSSAFIVPDKIKLPKL